MKYTEHFDDKTDQKIMDGIVNEVLQNKMKIVLTELEKARKFLNVPFIISSGYRTPEHNKEIGGKPNSQHLLGYAVDFQIVGYDLKKAFEWISHNLNYDQLIYETKGTTHWIHFSLKESNNRKQVLNLIV